MPEARSVPVPPYPVSPQVEVDPASTALLIVDMQNDFVRPDGRLPVASAPATVPVIQELARRARAAGALVIYTQDTHLPGDPEFALWGEHALRGSPGWEIVAELSPQPGDLVIAKPRYDAFYGTPLDHELRVRGIHALVVCGTVANICVHYTTASAALRWFQVICPKDAVSALDPFDLETHFRQTAFLFRGIVTTAEGIRFRG